MSDTPRQSRSSQDKDDASDRPPLAPAQPGDRQRPPAMPPVRQALQPWTTAQHPQTFQAPQPIQNLQGHHNRQSIVYNVAGGANAPQPNVPGPVYHPYQHDLFKRPLGPPLAPHVYQQQDLNCLFAHYNTVRHPGYVQPPPPHPHPQYPFSTSGMQLPYAQQIRGMSDRSSGSHEQNMRLAPANPQYPQQQQTNQMVCAHGAQQGIQFNQPQLGRLVPFRHPQLHGPIVYNGYCFNCWAYGQHDAQSCPDHHRRFQQREDLRILRGVPIEAVPTWRIICDGVREREERRLAAEQARKTQGREGGDDEGNGKDQCEQQESRPENNTENDDEAQSGTEAKNLETLSELARNSSPIPQSEGRNVLDPPSSPPSYHTGVAEQDENSEIGRLFTSANHLHNEIMRARQSLSHQLREVRGMYNALSDKINELRQCAHILSMERGGEYTSISQAVNEMRGSMLQLGRDIAELERGAERNFGVGALNNHSEVAGQNSREGHHEQAQPAPDQHQPVSIQGNGNIININSHNVYHLSGNVQTDG